MSQLSIIHIIALYEESSQRNIFLPSSQNINLKTQILLDSLWGMGGNYIKYGTLCFTNTIIKNPVVHDNFKSSNNNSETEFCSKSKLLILIQTAGLIINFY